MTFHWNWRIFRGSVNGTIKDDLHPCNGVNYRVTRVEAADFVRDNDLASISYPDAPLPDQLWRGVSEVKMLPGGVPYSFEYFNFLSTSTSREVAEKAVFIGKGDRRGILFAFSRDECAVCADLSWISKYPNEREIVFAPTIWRLDDNVA